MDNPGLAGLPAINTLTIIHSGKMTNSKNTSWLTYVLAVINASAFILIWVHAGFTSPSADMLLDWGGNLAPFTLTGESWRLLTSAFLHAGWMHLLLNLYMLILLGTLLERAIGSLRFGVVYLLSGLSGSLVSAMWYGFHESPTIQFSMGMALPSISTIHPVVSVGASGALMGLAGAAAALHFYAATNDETAPIEIKASAILQVIVLNLLSGLQISGSIRPLTLAACAWAS